MHDKLCRCGHEREAHTHYRRGTDCAICGADNCKAYSAARGNAAPVDAEPASTPTRTAGTH